MTALNALAIVSDAPGSGRVAPVRQFHVERGVVVRSRFSGVSTGTDRWVLSGAYQWFAWKRPIVIGYQRWGVVESAPAGSGFEVGQPVAATASRPYVGATAGWGGHVSVASSPVEEVFDAEGVDPVAASPLVSAQVGVNAASRLTESPGSRILVMGDGIIGASGALAARARGYEVLAVGHRPERLAALAAEGIATYDSRAGVGVLPSEFEPVGVVDTVQSDSGFALYMAALPRLHASIVFSGHTPGGATHWADMTEMQKREVTAHFVSGWTRERLELTLQLMREGLLPVEKLVGVTATTAHEVDVLVGDLLRGRLEATAAVVDWAFAT